MHPRCVTASILHCRLAFGNQVLLPSPSLSIPTLILGDIYSISHGAWRMPAGHGNGAILHNKTGSVLSIRAAITDENHENITQFIMIVSSIALRVQLGPCIHFSIIAQISMKMNISRLRDIVGRVLSFSSPYLFLFHHFFRLRITMHCMAIQFNSIGPVSNPFGV